MITISIFAKTLSFFSPKKAIQHQIAKEFINSGYSDSGASKIKKALKGMISKSKSPVEDIDYNLNTLRQRSRSLFMGSALARSAINTNRTNVVGEGLKLKPRIDYKLLNMTKETAKEWSIRTEKEFLLWAESKFCDTTRVNNFYELQQLAFTSWILNGDGFCIIEMDNPTQFYPYSLRLHMIEADRIYNPRILNSQKTLIEELSNGNKIINGVEINKNGSIVAYYVSSHYMGNNLCNAKFTRIQAYGDKTGNPNILHLMESERCEQYRGVPYLSPVIESLLQITRYTEAELTAAVIQAFFTVFIKQTGNRSEIPFEDSISESERVDDADPTTYELGAGTINVLGENEDVVFADPKRPASGFEGFVTSITKHIGAALEIPHELLTKSFLASYSASRAALLEAWKSFRMKRTWFANDFCKPVYELWLNEAVARGRINAPGYFADPIIRKAWQGSEWIGPAPGQIDPVKEVNAAKLRVENGFSTRERETTEINGGDFENNIVQLEDENKKMIQAGLIFNGGVDGAQVSNNSQ